VQKVTITFQDREYQVIRGSLAFSNPYRTEAVLNFLAETKIREYRVTLTFNGTFDRIYHDLSSDPPLPRDDIYALLGIGNIPGETAGVDVSTVLAGQEVSRFITNPIANPLERGFRRVFGLQKFQIDPTYVQSTQVATARITLQKDISSDFSITYSTNLFTAAEEIVLLQYRLTDEIQMTASKDEQDRYGVDALVTKTFE
jgi:translocation and assembly module TamB